MGVLAKIAGVITSIPDCVMGGMTIFLFCNVLVSGIALFGGLDMKSRRTRFIAALSLAVGVGVTVWPFAFQDMRASSYTAAFWECSDCSETMKGFRNGVSIFLSTGYCIGSVIAIIVNLILPKDPEDDVADGGEVDFGATGAKSASYQDSEVGMTKEDGGVKLETSSEEVEKVLATGDAATPEQAVDDENHKETA